MAVVGLLRRVTWGRFPVSLVSVLGAYFVLALIVPDIDDYDEGGPPLELLLGFMPLNWVLWLATVFGATLVLLPALVIGWKKSWNKGEMC